jgi:anti-sigma regulatory factor (Ser/Thr protein kinase)
MAAGVRFERRRELLVVYDELATNVAKHAAEARELVVGARRGADGEVTLTVEDDGAWFDPFAREPAATDRPLEEREPGGLGVLLVRELATRVAYRRAAGRNRVEVVLGT